MPPQQTSPFETETEDDDLIDATEPTGDDDPDAITGTEDTEPKDVESRLSRAEKREERSSERYSAMERREEESRNRVAQLEAQVHQMGQHRAPAHDPIKKFDDDADDIYRQREELQDEINLVPRDQMTPEKKSRYAERHKLLERQQSAIAAAKDRVLNAPPPRNERLERIKAQYPDVAADPLKMQMAVAFHAHHHGKGDADDDKLVARAMTYARKQSFDEDSNRSSDGARSKFAGGKNAGSAGDDTGRDMFRMQPHDKLMAEAAYPDIDEKEAHKKYAQMQIAAQKKNKQP